MRLRRSHESTICTTSTTTQRTPVRNHAHTHKSCFDLVRRRPVVRRHWLASPTHNVSWQWRVDGDPPTVEHVFSMEHVKLLSQEVPLVKRKSGRQQEENEVV